MKFLIYIYIFLSLLVLNSCREEIYFPEETTGIIELNSTPQNALIFLESNSTGRSTPDSIPGLLPGLYQITLKLTGYQDTTFSVDLRAGQKSYVHINFAE